MYKLAIELNTSLLNFSHVFEQANKVPHQIKEDSDPEELPVSKTISISDASIEIDYLGADQVGSSQSVNDYSLIYQTIDDTDKPSLQQIEKDSYYDNIIKTSSYESLKSSNSCSKFMNFPDDNGLKVSCVKLLSNKFENLESFKTIPSKEIPDHVKSKPDRFKPLCEDTIKIEALEETNEEPIYDGTLKFCPTKNIKIMFHILKFR